MTAGHEQRELSAHDVLPFVMPGFLHAMGNCLFAIRGTSHVLGAPTADLDSLRAALREASDRSAALLEVLRVFESEVEGEPQPIAPLLDALDGMLKIPLRERGIGFTLAYDSIDAERASAASLCIPLCYVVYALAEALWPAPDATIAVEVAPFEGHAVDLTIAVEARDARLPFPVPLERISASVADHFDGLRAEIDLVDGGDGVRVRIPS